MKVECHKKQSAIVTSQPHFVPSASYVRLSLKSAEVVRAKTGHMQLVCYIRRERNSNEVKPNMGELWAETDLDTTCSYL